MKKIRKAVFPVAGLGTRFLPATKAMPKELLPIIDKPIIQYAVEEAVAAGITDLIFVTGRTKRAIEDHFDANPELEIQIVALPRVFNLSKREADMAIMVSRPETGRLVVQKLTDYKLHLAASETYLHEHGPIGSLRDLRGHRIVGYIPDMIFDKELDYLHDKAFERVALASNSVSVQINWIRQGGGVGVVHDFALPAVTGVRKVLTDQFSLTRSFYLVRHEDDRRIERLNRFAALLSEGVRREVARLERLT